MIRYTFYLLSVLHIIVGCKHSANHVYNGHDHGHEDPLETFTLYSDHIEVYAEYEPLEAGKKSEFIVYITQLDTYSPIELKKVTISLIKGNNGIRHSVKPENPGVYKPALKPIEAGVYSLIFDLESDRGTVQLTYPGIRVFDNHEMIHDSIVQNKSGLEITFLKPQAWSTDFSVKKVEKKPFNEVISTSGQLFSADSDKSLLVAPHDGRILLKQQLAKGKYVKKGNTLLFISGEGIAFDNLSESYTERKTSYELAKANYERAEKLITDKIITQREFDEAKREYKVAKTAFENLNARTNGGRSTILSNANGFISEVFIENGEFVHTGDPLLSISQNKKLILKVDVSQDHWHCLPDITSANFLTPSEAKVYNTTELGGKLIAYGRNATASAWSTPVYFEVDARPDLIPGSFVEVYLLSRAIPDVLAIPISALTEEQGSNFIYVQLGGETFEKRQVKTGISNGSEIEIVSGLTHGERVVAKGAYQIKLASMSAVIPDHGHEH